jgi:hypothetical protein
MRPSSFLTVLALPFLVAAGGARAPALVIALVILAAPGLAAAGAFSFAVVGGSLVVVGSGSGAVAVGALGMAMGASMSTRSLGTPIPSLLVVEAMPLDAKITLDGKDVGTARERASYALDLAPGRHTIRITAPGHKPLTGRFVADPAGYMTKIRAVLVPE